MGFEPTHNGFASRHDNAVTNETTSTSGISKTDFAESPAKLLQKYTELCRIIEAWVEIPDELRQQIVGMIIERENDRQERG